MLEYLLELKLPEVQITCLLLQLSQDFKSLAAILDFEFQVRANTVFP